VSRRVAAGELRSEALGAGGHAGPGAERGRPRG
jgi:hypothetical protein